MAFAALGGLSRQVSALTKKNLVLLVSRHWFWTLLQAVAAPVVLLALVLNIPNYGPSNNRYGYGSPTPVRALQDAVPSAQSLVFVRPPSLGPDVDTVIAKVAASLPADQTRVFKSKNDTLDLCMPSARGVSACYSVVAFSDSPLSADGNRTWNYTIRADPARTGYPLNVHSNSNDHEIYYFPIQLAVDNAITNSTDRPDEYMFTIRTQVEMDAATRFGFNSDLVSAYTIVYFLTNVPTVYMAVSFVTSERAEGVAQLVDAMGGGPAARVLSSILAFSAVQFVGWVLSGVLYFHLVFYDSNAAILIFWQIFSGLAFVCASVFAAAFFKRKRISSIFVVICIVCLAGGSSILVNNHVDTATVAAMAALFPSANYIFALSHMARFPMLSQPIDMAAPRVAFPPLPDGVKEGSDADPFQRVRDDFYVSVWIFWLLLIIQILVYPLLAILAEKQVHGINFKNRILSDTSTEGSSTPGAAIRATGLSKTYKSRNPFKKRSTLKALDNVDLVAQKRQILCLLGVNGAGKSTTLDLLSGFIAPTAGEMRICARPSQLGVCPQKNVLFAKLTVLEHVRFWSELKGGGEDLRALRDLIDACDLTAKTNSQARTLSGGQKRKLQLACMFVGGASVCLMDEVTTGLDPISRRTIWNIILAERSKRSMVFTTHFLDEGEVLADHIVILSKGQIKCQGPSAELKNRFGGGYRVYLPKDADVAGIDLPKTTHQDHVVYRTPDSSSAARLVARIEAAGQADVRIAGPTIEDVFLKVAQDDVSSDSADRDKTEAEAVPSSQQLSAAKPTTFLQQVRILMAKRLRILPRYWVGAFLALALPIACIPPTYKFMDREFQIPICHKPVRNFDSYENDLVFYQYRYGDEAYNQPFGPPSANQTLLSVLETFPIGGNFSTDYFAKDWIPEPDFDSFQRAMRNPVKNVFPSLQGGLWTGDPAHQSTFAYLGENGISNPVQFLRLYTSMRSGVKIAGGVEVVYSAYSNGGMDGGGSWQYILYAAFIFTVYPAFFSLYPAFERSSNVRSLQISNGVRALPMWVAYFLFDLCFVILVSVAYTVTITLQFPYWRGPSYMLAICLFHGVTGILVSYIVSTRVASQLSAFFWTLGLSAVSYFGLALAYMLPSLLSDPLFVQRNTDVISYVLDIIFPIGNVFRGMAVGLNLYQLACRNEGLMAEPGSWWGYGFPITYLVIQILILAALLVWLDSDLSFSMFRRRGRSGKLGGEGGGEAVPHEISEIATLSGVEKEAARVEMASADSHDLLRMIHVSKSFKGVPAVEDVSLGLGQGEILALLGPNGAGKTTIVNMIRGALRPDAGRIFLRDTDITAVTQQHAIGVCPQFDALDLMTARQHLEFYARIKGVRGKAAVRANAEAAMARVGLTPHAERQAAALSGGNRRKLSLAIALMGDPAVLILDEPSSSMDAAAKRRMWKVLAEEVAPGRSVLLTTHSMEEADVLATRAAILSQRMLAIGTTQTLRQRYSNLYHVELVLRTAPHSTEQEMSAVEEWVREHLANAAFEGVSVGGQVKFMVPGSSTGGGVGRVIELLEQHKEQLGLQDYSIGAPTLERVFLSVVRDNFVEEEEHRKPAWRRFLGLA